MWTILYKGRPITMGEIKDMGYDMLLPDAFLNFYISSRYKKESIEFFEKATRTAWNDVFQCRRITRSK